MKALRILVKAVGSCKGREAARVLGKAVTVLLESMRSFEGASPCPEMLLESMSVFLEAVIVLVSTAKVLVEAARVLYGGVDVLISAVRDIAYRGLESAPWQTF